MKTSDPTTPTPQRIIDVIDRVVANGVPPKDVLQRLISLVAIDDDGSLLLCYVLAMSGIEMTSQLLETLNDSLCS